MWPDSSDTAWPKGSAELGVPLAEIVIPASTQAKTFVNDTFTFGVFATKQAALEINAMGNAATPVRTARVSGRALLICLAGDSLVATAPARVQTAAATIDPFDGASFVLDASPNSDIWIVAQAAEALRLAYYHWLFLLGYRQFLPHPIWIVRPRPANFNSISVNGVVRPAWATFLAIANGTYLSQSGPPGIPDQASSMTYWLDWHASARWPLSYQGGNGDGDEQFTTYDQWFLRHDHTGLAWTPGQARGWNATSGNFPAGYFSGDVLAKINPCDHGTPGVPLDAAGVGSTPWVGVAPVAAGTTQANQESISGLSAGALDADLVADSAADHVQTDYASFSGVAARSAKLKRDRACANINTYGTNAPQAKYVSAEPADGTSHCQCTSCLNLRRNGPWGAYLTAVQKTQDSSIADRVVHHGNFQAEYLTYWFNGKIKIKAGWLAYGEFAEPPVIPVSSNALIMVLTNTFQTYQAVLRTEFITAWGVKRSTNPLGVFDLGVQPSWLLGDSNIDQPKMSPRFMFAEAKRLITAGFGSMVAQTTYSSFAVGIGFYAIGRLLLDPLADIEAILAEFFVTFGPAATQVQLMFERWWSTPLNSQFSFFTLNAVELAASFANLSAAQTALNAAPSTTYQGRVDQAIMFVQWLATLYEFRNARRNFWKNPTVGNQTALDTAFDNWNQWAWNIPSSNVTHSNRGTVGVKFNEFLGGNAGGGITNFVSTPVKPAVVGTATVNTLRIEVTTGGAVGAMVFKWSANGGAFTTGVTSSGIGNALAGTGVTITFPAVTYTTSYVWAINFQLIAKWDAATPGSGFAGTALPSTISLATVLANGVTNYPAISGVARRTFGTALVPFTTTATTTLIQTCANSQSPQSYYFRKTSSDINFTLRTFAYAATASGVPSRIVIRDLLGNIVQSIIPTAAGSQFSSADTACTVTGMPAGIYELHLIPSRNEGPSLLWPQNVHLVQVTGEYPFYNGDGSAARIYFYVPVATTKIGLAFDSGPGVQFFDDAGTSITTDNSTFQLHTAAVAAGHDGKVWSFTGIQGVDTNAAPRPVNFPAYFSYHPDQLLVPSGLDGF